MHNIFKIDCHMLCNFIEITLWHGCSPVNLLHIFRTIFSKNTSGWLLLDCNSCQTSNHTLWCSKKNKKYARLAVNTYPLKNVALKFRALPHNVKLPRNLLIFKTVLKFWNGQNRDSSHCHSVL